MRLYTDPDAVRARMTRAYREDAKTYQKTLKARSRGAQRVSAAFKSDGVRVIACITAYAVIAAIAVVSAWVAIVLAWVVLS